MLAQVHLKCQVSAHVYAICFILNDFLLGVNIIIWEETLSQFSPGWKHCHLGGNLVTWEENLVTWEETLSPGIKHSHLGGNF